MREGILSPDQAGSSHILAYNGLFWQFLPIRHSVDQFFGPEPTGSLKHTVNIWGEVFSVQIKLDHAISYQLKISTNDLFGLNIGAIFLPHS